MVFSGHRSGTFAAHGVDDALQHSHRVVHPGTAHGGDGGPEVAAEVVAVAAVGGERHVGEVAGVHQRSACGEREVWDSVFVGHSITVLATT